MPNNIKLETLRMLRIVKRPPRSEGHEKRVTGKSSADSSKSARKRPRKRSMDKFVMHPLEKVV